MGPEKDGLPTSSWEKVGGTTDRWTSSTLSHVTFPMHVWGLTELLLFYWITTFMHIVFHNR